MGATVGGVETRSDSVILPGVLALATVAAWILTGNIGVALAPILVVAAAWAVVRMPVRWPVTTLVFLALLVDNPQARPMEDRWRSPLYPVGELLYGNLNTLTGIEALRFSLFEVIILGLVCLLALRRVGGIGEDGVATLTPGAKWLIRGLAVALAAVIVLQAWGMVRGGDFRQSLWQVRQLVWLPLLCWLSVHAFRRRTDVWLVMGIFLVVGTIRAIPGFTYYFISRLEGYVPSYVTTHSDSMLWMIGVLMCLIALAEKPSPKIWVLCLGYLPIASLALLINDRRIAFVCLAATVVVLVMMVRREVRRRVWRCVLVASPVLLIYLMAGLQIEHRVFKPVSALRSVFDDSDTSNHTRDVENFNLVFTALERPVVGSGFGHPYTEHLYTHRIDHVFEQYSFMPHNSVLWLFAVGGLVGFLCLWGFLPLVVWICSRSYPKSEALSERVAALTGVGVVVSYLIQAWGDMGVHSWMISLILASSVGLVANLERWVGGWVSE